jgi:vanillate O-demethylase monooxygenase subunit
MLEAIQRRMKGRDFWSMEPLLLTVDGAAVLSRRILQKMIATEEQHRPIPVLSHADAGNAG